MAKANVTKEQWAALLGESQRNDLVKLLMGARRAWSEGKNAEVYLKIQQALRLMGEN